MGKRNVHLADMHEGAEIPFGTTDYKLVHKWINTHYPRNGRCEYCGTTGRRTFYATARPGWFSHNRADWFEFCGSCHARFDGRSNYKTGPGEANPRSKLTDDDVREIRRLRAEGHTIVSLGQQFGVTHVMISRIFHRKAWSHVD